MIYEVPISYHGRTYEQGKKIGFKDGIAALWYILKFNLFCSLTKSYRTVPARHGVERSLQAIPQSHMETKSSAG